MVPRSNRPKPDSDAKAPGRRPAGATARAGALIAVVAAAAGPAGCGASVSAVYEGDVRFEHCMALDARPSASPSERRMCWIEWVRYYTYGQTQDRVEYARARSSGAEGLADAADRAPAPLAAPEPTSAFAPPPMVATSAAPPATSASTRIPGAPGASVAPAPTAAPLDPDVDPACQSDCGEAREDCRASCQGASCEKSCSGKFSRCLERCAEVRGRPRP